MPRPAGKGKTRTVFFDKVVQGQAAMTGELWVDLGLIPNGAYLQFGFGEYVPDGKKITFDLRSNLATKSAGTDADTVLHGRTTVRDGDVYEKDYYKNGRLQTITVTSTGVEHFWLKLTSKSQANADAYYWIYYTEV